jgi:hypothetical protein
MARSVLGLPVVTILRTGHPRFRIGGPLLSRVPRALNRCWNRPIGLCPSSRWEVFWRRRWTKPTGEEECSSSGFTAANALES